MRIMCLALLILGVGWFIPAQAETPEKGLMPLTHKALGEPQVEVNLSGTLFKFMARAASDEEPELGSFLMGLKAIHVRIYDAVQISDTIGDVARDFHRELERKKWEILARIREQDSNIGVYILADEDKIEGLFVVVSEVQQLILVNIAGNIDLAQVGKLGKVAGVDLELPDLDPTKPRPTKEQQEQIDQHREDAMQSLRDGQVDDAIAHLQQIPMLRSDHPEDFGMIAALQILQGKQDAAYYYLGRAYESQDNRTFARQLYRHAQQLNPNNPLVQEKLSQ